MMLYFQIMLLMVYIHLLTWPPPADLLNSCTRKSQNVRRWDVNCLALIRSRTCKKKYAIWLAYPKAGMYNILRYVVKCLLLPYNKMIFLLVLCRFLSLNSDVMYQFTLCLSTLPLSSPFLPFSYQIFRLFLFLFFILPTTHRPPPPTVSITSTDIPPRIHYNIQRDSPEKF
jgi:hypothetical protein